ncbi:MAG: S41 family peptidase [Planctomycetota bacterium JB042]
MNSATRAFLTAFLVPALVATTCALFMYHVLFKDALRTEERDEMAWIMDAARLVSDRYYEQTRPEELAYDAIRGIVNRDPYSQFIDPDMEDEFTEENEGNYVGIGFMIYGDAPAVTVLYAFPGSPAEGAGLGPGDRIVGVDGVDTREMSTQAVTDLIKVKDGEGKPVDLRIQPWAPEGETADPYERKVLRARIWRPSVVDPRIVDPERGIGYVRMKQFQERSVDELEEALNRLALDGMKSLVLDLRGNRGGFLDQAIEVTSLFLDDGIVLRTEGRTPGTNEVYRTSKREATFRGVPLALLVDRASASATEIVAGALQDHLRATLVGDRTFGKGMVQSVIPRRYVVDGEERIARIKITTSRWITPAGRSLERLRRRNDDPQRFVEDRGLHPDLFVPIRTHGEQRWLYGDLADREIDEETWAEIAERCPAHERNVESEDGHVDRQLRAAVDQLRGEKVFPAID